MIEVIPLKYGAIFKRAFSQPEVFTQFVKDVLGIEIHIEKVYTEYEYPQTVGFVRSQYDLFAEDVENRIIVEIQHIKEEDFFDRFLYYHLTSLVEQVGGYQEYAFDRTVYTIVVLTSIPRDGSVTFSCAVSDMNPTDEHGRKHDFYPHRLVFLCPRLINHNTPLGVRRWLELIEDSLDGKVEENVYPDQLFQMILSNIRKQSIDPALLSEIKDDAAWEKAKRRFMREAREDGVQEGLQLGLQQGIEQGLEQGLQRGVQEGDKQARLETARAMLKDGIALETVLKYTGLTVAEVSETRES